MEATLPLWWVSFADPDLGFLGACIIEASTDLDVIPACWRAGCNPGGEAQFVEIPSKCRASKEVARYQVGRLYSKAEIAALDGEEPVLWDGTT